MATQREKTHIQYPNMYKLYVSCNYIQEDSFCPGKPDPSTV